MRAGASKSQLYLYFDDRADLLRAVARKTCDAVLAAQADLLEDFDSYEGLERYLDATIARQEQRRARGCSIGSLAGQLANRDEPARLALADGFARWERGLRDGLASMAERGELRSGTDLDQLATQVLAAIQGGLVLTQVRRDTGQLRIAADAILSLVRQAMRRRR